jgi:hypothetical protein
VENMGGTKIKELIEKQGGDGRGWWRVVGLRI